ncbi:MAG: ABC transporter substrate-binding protein [Arcanobacterium sp.]|nr:ABC transporter substrate-binding protein [Arcanobacterium sp.]MDY5589466.1 ABC transporter substrate-binding protein [Arcanobacterium sp.]
MAFFMYAKNSATAARMGKSRAICVEHRFSTVRSLIVLIAVATVSGLGLTACAPAPETAGANSRTVSFMLSWAPDTNHIGVYVAKNKGWFTEKGLAVDILAVAKSGAEQAVNNGLADFALSNLSNVATFSAKGAQLKQVLQVQQKPSAIWCALASNTAITRPRDLDGTTFATFGSSESDAVVKRMIQTDGGRGNFDKVTVGTDTFRTLGSGKADFGGFYATWEGVQAQLHGPKLTCFHAEGYGVPGNPDAIGIITSKALIAKDPQLVRTFVQVVQRGYEYAYAHPDEAADILVKEAAEANLEPAFVKASMKTIVEGRYWGNPTALAQGTEKFGAADFMGTQQYFNFLHAAHAYVDQSGAPMAAVPQSKQLATDEFLAQ